MFLSALQAYSVAIIIPIVVLQYAFAVFCLLKLAYLDMEKREYVLWNVFILLVFFIGGIAFLVYYKKHGKEKEIKPEQGKTEEIEREQSDPAEAPETAEQNGGEGESEPEKAQEDK